MVWGDFDAAVMRMRAHFATMPADLPMMDALRQAVVTFNALPPEQAPQHRQRMALILGTPTLFARSAVRFVQWRGAVAEFAAGRLGQQPQHLLPRVIGYSALGAALAAYEQWLAEESSNLSALVDEAFREMAVGFDHHGRY